MQELKFHFSRGQNPLFTYLSLPSQDSTYLLLCDSYSTSTKCSRLPSIVGSHPPVLVPSTAINDIAKVLSLDIHESPKRAQFLLGLELRASQKSEVASPTKLLYFSTQNDTFFIYK